VLRRTVRILSSILRVAESLDRSHAQVISGLEVEDRGADVLMQLRTSGDAELEMWAASRHIGPFQKLLQKPIRLSAAKPLPARRAARESP
jgi:exopolyphosphatase/guanosine-5'-triphosphate,3'-diphosphate pyrophosphatase